MAETIEMQLTTDERRALRELTARPEETGWGPGVVIERVDDIAETADGWTVRVTAVTPGDADARRAVDDALRRFMAERQQAPRPKDELDVQTASGADAVDRE